MRALLLAVVMLLGAQIAHAQEDAAAAEVLFREGQKLFDEGRAEEACPKFAASYQLDKGLGTLTNLARCYETIGKTATAWAKWVDLEALATRAGQQDRVKIAKEHLQALEPKLVKLTIAVPERVDGLEVSRGAVKLKDALFGVAVAVDPGKHRVSASAPGHQPWEREVTVDESTHPVVVVVPRLTPEPIAQPDPPPPPDPVVAPVPTPPPPPETPFPTLQVVGGVMVGLGVVGFAVAGGFTAAAASSWADADCSDGLCPTDAQQTLSEDANREADLATGFVVIGGVLAAAGATLFLVGLLDDDTVETTSRGILVRF